MAHSFVVRYISTGTFVVRGKGTIECDLESVSHARSS
jgi:hypothetical protein